MSIVIGIDLGTSTTEAAVYRNGKPEMLLTADGKTIVPSFAGIAQDGNWIVGDKAKAQALLYPENTAMEIKRRMGKGELISLGNQKYSPVTLSARILEYVKNYAGEYLQEEVTRAVISVPAYFDDIQRSETIKAGELAGFQVERILNEPTAAAMSYGLEHMDEESHILVYDLGGGTFDVTLLEMFDGVLEVKASSGDNELGGKDFDQKLIDYLVGQFHSKHGINLKKDRFAMMKIRDEAEACKIALSTQDSYRVLIPMIAKKEKAPLELDETITADQFKKMTADLIERTHKPILTVLEDGKCDKDRIDRIILVGGSTRMPLVTEDIESFLQMEPSRAVDPDFAVAQGAAIQAGIIAGVIDPEEGLVMTDVNPYTLGIEVVTHDSMDRMSVIIPRNVTIPTSRTEMYYTFRDYQTAADIRVFQGESMIASSNHFLGDFRISGIPAKRAGKEAISVTFSYDLNGMLDVQAMIVSNRKKASIQIDMTDSVPEKDDGPADGEENMDTSRWQEAPEAEEYRALIRRAERMKKKAYDKGMKDEGRMLEKAIELMKKTIILGNRETMEEAEDALFMVIKTIGLML